MLIKLLVIVLNVQKYLIIAFSAIVQASAKSANNIASLMNNTSANSVPMHYNTASTAQLEAFVVPVKITTIRIKQANAKFVPSLFHTVSHALINHPAKNANNTIL
jgi:hypothetical protein